MSEEPKLPIPEANGLCNECLENNSQIVDGDTIVFCYCLHNQTGGLYQVDLGIWRLSTPISPTDFYRLSRATREGIKRGKELAKNRINSPKKFN